jgi:hypothetical protein
MGWFSDTVTYTGDIAISHLIDKLPENPIKAAVREAVLSDYEIIDAVVAARTTTMGSKVLAYYVKDSPDLDLPRDDFPSQLGGVLPIITIRENRNNILGSGMTSKIDATTKALGKINASLHSITAGVDSGGGMVNDVHVMFAANVWSDTTGTAEYFFRLFKKLYDPTYDEQWWMGFTSVTATDSFDAAADAIEAKKDVNAAIDSGATPTDIEILSLDLAAKEDFLITTIKSIAPKITSWDYTKSPLIQGYKTHYVTNDSEYTQVFKYSTITSRIAPGVIGPVGHYVKSLKDRSATSILDTTTLGNFDSVSVSKQITPTVCETYTIYGMTVVNQVRYDNGDYKYIEHTVSSGLHGTFIVPLFTSITKEMSDFAEEQFLSDSLILYVQTVSSTKRSWFQSSVFMWIIAIIVIIIITVVTWGGATAGAILAAQGIMAAVVYTATTVIITIISSIVLSYIVKGIISLLAPLIGKKAATILTAVVVIVIALYTGYADTSIADLPWAEILLKTGAAVIDTAQSVIQLENAEELLKLTAEITGFAFYSDLVNKEITRGLDLLDTSIDNLLYSTVNSVLIVRETPDDFYQRTIHQGNVGMLGISAVSDYTQNKLILPKEFPS